MFLKNVSRVLKPGGKLALTTNLNGHWKEFYLIFEETLKQLGKTNQLEKLKQQQEHRGTIESISKLFAGSNFKINRYYTESFEMKFLDGSAFLNHYFVKLGWLASWLDLFPKEEHEPIFSKLEQNLNLHSKTKDGLTLTVPMAFVEGEKI